MSIRVAEARWPDDRVTVEALFREYMSSLTEDISFQNPDDELASLPGKYARPGGVVLIAWDGAEAAGAIAYRMLEPGVAEMKRLYVRPAYRGSGLGRELANELIEEARARGFRRAGGGCAPPRARSPAPMCAPAESAGGGGGNAPGGRRVFPPAAHAPRKKNGRPLAPFCSAPASSASRSRFPAAIAFGFGVA